MAELVLTGAQPFSALACVLVFLGLSAVLARLLGWRGVEGLALGFLVLAGAANLALFALRLAPLPVHFLAPLTILAAVTLSLVLRAWVLPAFAPRPARLAFEWLVLGLVLAAYWVIRIIQIDASTGLSSQLGWTPNYIRASLEAGRFLLPQDFALGEGPAQFLYYSVDLLGLSALPASLGWAVFYPSYLASSITAGGLALAVALGALRGHALAQGVFLILAALIASGEIQFQAALLRHWGDSTLILGGTLIMTRLPAPGSFNDNLRVACVAALFLVFGRHYGAFFAALLLSFSALWALSRDWRAALADWWGWAALAALLVLFSLREINYILHPTLYYPGNKLLTLVGSGAAYHIRGALHDWGLLTDGGLLATLARLVWVAALAILVWTWRRRTRPVVLLASFAVMLLPLFLHVLTGYRSAQTINKPYLLGLLFLPWFPALIVAALTPDRLRLRLASPALWAGLALLAGGSGVAVAGVASPFLARIHDAYQGRNIDLTIAQALDRENLADEAAARPILYFYCEPGMGLRNYIGGDLRQDVDFWGSTAQDLMADMETLPQLLEKLGWPNLYLSSPADYRDFVPGADWRRFHPAGQNLASAPWVERVVEAGGARFVIVRRPPT